MKMQLFPPSLAIRYGLSVLLCVSGLSLSAYAQGITVDAPAGPQPAGPIVNSPFYVQAEAPTCDSKTTTSFGYSVDSGGTTYVSGTTIATMLTLAAGAHTIHFKSYNGGGTECTQATPLTVGSGVAVSAPALSATLPGTFNLVASAPTCGGDGTSEMGYSVDSGSVTTGNVTSFNTLVASGLSSGAHILRVKAFSGSLYCETDIPFSVVGGIAAASGANLYTSDISQYPYNGIEAENNYIGAYAACPQGSKGAGNDGATQAHGDMWQTQPDCGTVGSKSNVNTIFPVTSEVHGQNADSREFTFTYGSTGGGVRWFNSLPDNSNTNAANHFLYDAYLYIAPGSNVGEIEMDVNHASPANNLYLIGVQCDLASGTWDITEYGHGWIHTANGCTNVSTGVWHHLQVLSHHDANPGTTIYYDQVALDGAVQTLSCPSLPDGCESTMESLSWGEGVGPNFQLDGGGSGGSSITAYVDNFNLWYW
ncbi:MAG TPA: hypothetical protein VHZ09_15835 [Acidobacteriaceae bacterium]|jgi:hypothetical protein|nr:hypothetical protein [Acidobacteriaceae bacterium]